MAAALKAVKAKGFPELVVKAKTALEKVDGKNSKASDEASKYLDAMKKILCGDGATEPVKDNEVAIAQKVYETKFVLLMVQKMDLVEFETKKDAVQIFTKLLRREIGARNPTAEHFLLNQEILNLLVKGYDKRQVDALNCGLMLRECIKIEQLAKIVLHDENMFNAFYGYVQVSTFDIAADAFSTFKDLLTKHKIMCADFLDTSYDQVMARYMDLLQSTNYVTRRQSLKLLGELLLDRANFTIMTRYIGDPENLKLMMNMLRDKSKNIQFEAFHVFKVFVANPNKSKAILDILLKNKSKLIDFLTKFHESRSDDEQFAEEKSYLIKQIKDL
jgi:calcium binding protein 39